MAWLDKVARRIRTSEVWHEPRNLEKVVSVGLVQQKMLGYLDQERGTDETIFDHINLGTG